MSSGISDVTLPRGEPAAPADLSDRVAVVTGASSGLGRHLVELFTRNGAAVVAVARRGDRLADLVDEVAGRGGRCLPFEIDLRDAGRAASIFSFAESRFGTVDVLVNNAGVQDRTVPHELSLDEIDASIETNVRAPFVLACECARRLIAARRPGHIINVSSIGAFTYTGGGRALYSTTKAALARMTETFAIEWVRHGINVNAIAPGAFASEMLDEVIREMGDITGNFPRRRYGDPTVLDSTVLYLLSHASSFVTGTVVKIDDGGRPR